VYFLHLTDFDLDVDTGRQVETLERINGLGGVVNDVQKTLVHSHLEVLTTVFVLVGSTNHRVTVLLGGQGHRPLDPSVRALDGLDDLGGGLIQDAVVEGLQPDANHLTVVGHDLTTSRS
jgi:hypothetical protein